MNVFCQYHTYLHKSSFDQSLPAVLRLSYKFLDHAVAKHCSLEKEATRVLTVPVLTTVHDVVSSDFHESVATEKLDVNKTLSGVFDLANRIVRIVFGILILPSFLSCCTIENGPLYIIRISIIVDIQIKK